MTNRAAAALCALSQQSDQPLLILCPDENSGEALAATLTALAGDRPIIFLPSSDQLPGDDAPASPANTGRRLSALTNLRTLSNAGEMAGAIVVSTGEAAARRYPPPRAFDERPPVITTSGTLDMDSFPQLVAALGYIEDDIVDEAGEVCFRGSVVDIYPADAGEPVRIDLEGNRIAALHHYDPATQLTRDTIDAISIARACEPEDLPEATLLDHVTPGRVMVLGDADKRRARFIALATEAARGGSVDAVEEESWKSALIEFDQVDMNDLGADDVPRFVEQRRPARALRAYLLECTAANTTCVIMGSARDLRFLGIGLNREKDLETRKLASLAKATGLRAGELGLIEGPLDAGVSNGGIALIAAADIIGSRAQQEGESPQSTPSGGALDFLSVTIGDTVIHEDHGVARLIGLVEDPASPGAELIALEYARDGRRLVAPSDAGRLWRYGSDADAVTLDTLNGKSWEKRKLDVMAAVAGTARDLVALATERAALEAPVIEAEPAAYERFAATFPFTETPDQARAIEAVRGDLASGHPMERLVIGDVGYGKTEVALRAAAMTALSGYQVMVAAPTTVLARQHLREFERRFAKSGVRVAGLLGTSTAAEKKAIATELAAGTPLIVVGTAAVAGKAIRYAKLGLVIVDEEQRFGAADKARLRSHPDTHLLVMSATPIPRTLHRSLVGLQAMSVIATPPARRQPVHTALKTGFDEGVGTALKREKMRRGQSFVVVPRIADLDAAAAELARLVPDQVIVRAHGRMPAAQLDQAMVDFADGHGDILLATNIIETGLNVPRANTMIVWNADRFGLAQLHQLRGRVGRGRRRGSVILLSPGDSLTRRSRKRLEALARHGQLGAGFAIAAADLDQRGSGDLMSEAQSGHMKLIGIEYYQHLLEAAIASSRGESAPNEEVRMRLSDGGALPRDWIPDEEVRLNLYLRLSRLSSVQEVDNFADELADRFGALPVAAETLISARRLALVARDTGISELALGPGGCRIFGASPHSDVLEGAGFRQRDDRWVRAATGDSVLTADELVEAFEAR